MTDQSAVDTAVKRLALALDALDAAVERRTEADQSEEALANQVQALGADRSRLAAALDGETARSRKLEATNREVAQRLETAMATIQSVLGSPVPAEEEYAEEDEQEEAEEEQE